MREMTSECAAELSRGDFLFMEKGHHFASRVQTWTNWFFCLPVDTKRRERRGPYETARRNLVDIPHRNDES